MGSARPFGRPDAYAVVVQIKAPETEVPGNELDADLDFSWSEFARPHNPAMNASVFALENERAAGLHAFAQSADPGSGRADVQGVYEKAG